MSTENELSQKVATQHGLIESLLKGLHSAIESADAARAKARLSSLQRALEAHFKLEENHYYPAKRASRPELEADLERLVDEHERCRFELARIDTELDAAGWDAAARALAAFDSTLHQHEEFEQKLLGA